MSGSISWGMPTRPLGNTEIGDNSLTEPLLGSQRDSGLDGDSVTVRSGGLQDRTVSVGDGQEREQALESANRSKGFFAKVGEAFVSFGRAIKEAFAHESRETRLERQYVQANGEMLAALSAPMQDSVVDEPGVMDRLVAHAQTMGTPLSRDEIRGLVAMGERLSVALQGDEAGGGRSPVTVQTGAGDFQVDSGIHTTRALSWYMMSMGALQDSRREQAGQDGVSDMPVSGAFVMKDPGNRVYNFMNDAPTSCSRMSTHFNERTATEQNHKIIGLFDSGKPSQRGIEDYRHMMPGQGGTVLFDKLQGRDGDGELFVKFEHGGCPPYFNSRREGHEGGVGVGIGRFFGAVARNFGHAFSFLGSRGTDGPTDGFRQEHVYKGVLKEPVYTPFKALVDVALQQGLDLGDVGDAKAIAKAVNKFGLPFVQQMVARIEQQGRDTNQQGVVDLAGELQGRIGAEIERLGWASNAYGIERRGAEVHISLDPGQRDRIGS